MFPGVRELAPLTSPAGPLGRATQAPPSAQLWSFRLSASLGLRGEPRMPGRDYLSEAPPLVPVCRPCSAVFLLPGTREAYHLTTYFPGTQQDRRMGPRMI